LIAGTALDAVLPHSIQYRALTVAELFQFLRCHLARVAANLGFLALNGGSFAIWFHSSYPLARDAKE
jgi:hypothetical protein